MYIIDMILFMLYFIGVISGVYNFVVYRKYFKECFKLGVVSVFMLVMFFFLVVYIFKMVIVIWMCFSMFLMGCGVVLEVI